MRLALAVAALLALTLDAQAQNPAPPAIPGPRPVPTSVWASKPTTVPAYRPGLRPWIKLADVKAKHAGAAAWREPLFDDGRLMAEYVAAAPGTGERPRFHPDTREWFAVLEGEVRVAIEGQAPFTATRGSLVNVPRQTVYAVDTAGAAPSLRFVLNVSNAKTYFVADSMAQPALAPPAGAAWLDGHHQSHSRALRRVQPSSREHPRGGREEPVLHRRPFRARRQERDAGDLRLREEPAAA